MNAHSVEKQLNHLNQTADQALAGLHADRHLMLRIEKAAAQPQQETVRRPVWKPVLAGAMALALCVAVALPVLNNSEPQPILTAQSAGNTKVSNEVARNLPDNGVTIGRSSTSSHRSLWAESTGTFPLVGVNGKYYRMLTMPTSVSSGLLGDSLGTIAEFTTEPSLSGTDVLLSNIAAFDEEVFEISGMGDTLVATRVDGEMRLFQRVGFNGYAVRGGEKLADTLQISGHIRAMELGDIGTVTDSTVCEELFQILLDSAAYESSGALYAQQYLTIELDNGLTVQMAVRDESVAACGTWSCPEFFEAFEDAMEQ